MDDLSILNKQLEEMREQLRIQDKLSSLGMLSAGIAHEIQNPLNFVINFSKLSDHLLEDLKELLLRDSVCLPEDGKEEADAILCDLGENLRKIAEHGNRAIGIIRGILLYSRGKEDEYVPTDVARLTKEYVWLAYHAMRANCKNFNIAMREEYDGELPMVKLIPQDFSRVVLNIMNNACYAVWRKAQEHSDNYRPAIQVKLGQEESRLVLTIEDNGEGMSREVQQKLFEAFFTTKPVGQGTGLGMSIVKDLVEHKHHGSIQFVSEEKQYTRFTIQIPMNL